MKITTNVPHIDNLIAEIIKQAKEVKVPGLFVYIVTEAYCSTEEGTEGFVTVSNTYELDDATGNGDILRTNFFSNSVQIYESISRDGKFDIRFEGKVSQDRKGDVNNLEDHAKVIVDYLFSQGDYAPTKGN